ncbi:MAG: hypothetical protein ACC628_12190 [Pirellulaceae bacterium]
MSPRPIDRRLAWSLFGVLLPLAAAFGQSDGFRPAVEGRERTAASGRDAAERANARSLSPDRLDPQKDPQGEPITQVRKGDGELPHDHGQKYREYVIRPYTQRVNSTARPQQAIIDWILRETGTEVWFTEPVGLLSANRDVLRVYHTPEMHELVREVVDRFVASQAESHVFGLQLVTVGSPNWRSRALPLMRSVTVQSPGVDAWLVNKENAAVLINELRKRTDFREYNSPNVLVHNGQTQTISRLQPRHYTRSVRTRNGAFPSYELEMGQIQEGFSLQISPLLSLDERTVDAVLKCHIDQVEKFIPVAIEVPSATPQRQTVQIQVPQVVSWRLHERFRWATEEVLVLSCGVVATPSAQRPTVFGIPNLLAPNPGRADALLFIESKGRASQNLLNPERMANGSSPNNRGRY